MESIDLSTENPLDGSFLNISLEETVHTTKYDSYQCDICQKKFKSQHNLKRHLKIHDSTKFFCPSCTQYFDSEEKLNKHKIDKHSYNHLCTFCGKNFNKRQNMNEHIKAHEINNNW
jgi:KRAB domain-containing zinc finger protein